MRKNKNLGDQKLLGVSTRSSSKIDAAIDISNNSTGQKSPDKVVTQKTKFQNQVVTRHGLMNKQNAGKCKMIVLESQKPLDNTSLVKLSMDVVQLDSSQPVSIDKKKIIAF